MRMFNERSVSKALRLALVPLLAIALFGFAELAAAEETPVLLDFYATWCEPCRAMSPVVDGLAAEGYAVRRVNVDEEPDLAARFNVQRIPCFVVVEGGVEMDRVVGPTAPERLKQKLRRPGKPHAAWRYERPAGRFAPVVRIAVELDNGRALGSGVLVRWTDRVVVLSARHVIKGARRIIVTLATGRKLAATVLVASDWDCAVLELDGKPDVAAAEVEMGRAAVMREQDRLESCGYGGPETKLAVNSGLFLGYRRPSTGGDGHDDWFALSGPARPGDSGGPIFNGRGHVVGILWGTDGETTIGVQVGRLHMVLKEARFKQTACDCGPGGCDVGNGPLRNPTPPMDVQPQPFETAGENDSALPWRRQIEANEKSTAGALGRIDAKLDALARQPQDRSPAYQPDPRVDEALHAAQEANAKLDALTKLVSEKEKSAAEKETFPERVREKAGEIKEKIDGVLESPFAKHVAAIFGVIFLIGIGLWIAISQHRKAGTKTLAEKGADALATATAGTPVGALTSGLDKIVNDFGQQLRSLDSKLESKVSGLQQQVTQTALATPAPTQVSKPATT